MSREWSAANERPENSKEKRICGCKSTAFSFVSHINGVSTFKCKVCGKVVKESVKKDVI